MQTTDFLESHHAQILRLLAELEARNGHDPSTLTSLGRKLLAHMIVEQLLFYPALVELDRELILESFEEHADAQFQLQRVLVAEDGPGFRPRIKTLRELIQSHVKDEEAVLFPAAAKVLPVGEDQELFQHLEREFNALVNFPIPALFQRGARALRVEEDLIQQEKLARSNTQETQKQRSTHHELGHR